MPELSRFYGIVIQMYFGGHLPPRARGLVVEWATIHQDELREAFRKAEALESPGSISPLD
jgi:hypothetical protein